MKVASCISLEKMDEKSFKMWLDSLPLRLRGGWYELLWRRAKGKKSAVWTDRKGFVFY